MRSSSGVAMYNVRAAADEKGIQSIHPKKSKYIKDLNPLNSFLAKIDSKILETHLFACCVLTRSLEETFPHILL